MSTTIAHFAATQAFGCRENALHPKAMMGIERVNAAGLTEMFGAEGSDAIAIDAANPRECLGVGVTDCDHDSIPGDVREQMFNVGHGATIIPFARALGPMPAGRQAIR